MWRVLKFTLCLCFEIKFYRIFTIFDFFSFLSHFYHMSPGRNVDTAFPICHVMSAHLPPTCRQCPQPSANYKAEKVMSDKLNFPKHTGIREASLLVVKEKCGRYTLVREPLYLDRCVVCSEADWDEYFEIQEISSKDTFIFKVSTQINTIYG